MWDPRRYLDTNYGLDEDESFEPSDADEPGDVNLSLPHVMTVLGPIDPDDLGVCQPCEYIVGGPRADATGRESMRPDHLERVAAELEAYFTVGGRSMVDLSTRESGRDAQVLRVLSQRVPVHLVCAAGRPVSDRAGAGKIDVPALEAELLREIRDGIGPTGIRPGLIVLGTTRDGGATSGIVKAVAAAASSTGYPVVVSGATCDRALDLMARLEDEGLPPNRVVVLTDSRPGFDDLHALSRRGAWVTINRIGDERFVPDRQRAETIVRLSDDGFEGRLLVSQGLAGPDEFVTSGGGPGWIHLLERFTLDLMEAGADAGLVRRLLIENPGRALTIEPPDAPFEQPNYRDGSR